MGTRETSNRPKAVIDVFDFFSSRNHHHCQVRRHSFSYPISPNQEEEEMLFFLNNKLKLFDEFVFRGVFCTPSAPPVLLGSLRTCADDLSH